MLKKLEEELADVLIYCIAIANATGIDVTTAILNKMKRNEEKYPTERYKGTYSKPEK
jgi:NTP pyrophosphatase (non-canonical NTP hydrolase)